MDNIKESFSADDHFDIDDHFDAVTHIPIFDGDDGLVLDLTSSGLMVVGIQKGVVREFNKSQKLAGEKVRIHDIVVSVDNEMDPHKMLEMLTNSKEYTLGLIHPWISTVRIPKETGNLGMSLSHTPGSIVIEVRSIGEGDVRRYNTTADISQQVHKNCLIGTVNGVSGSSQQMLLKLKQAKEDVELTLYRVVADLSTLVSEKVSI